ncbi:MAG: hypothetical protein V3T17_06585 [Pseudomonadales bacterium]
MQKTLVKHRYLLLGKADRGVVTRYLMKVTGDSLAQTKRLIRQYANTGTVAVKPARRNGFKRAYTDADIRLLAAMDERHGQPSGPVFKKLLKSCVSAPTSALIRESMNGWPIFRCLTCITCAAPKPINASAAP